ncbi:DUF4360 domain-containing protein [Actinoplanes auranticolor]|uniref:DUF4360 domain-containing protein n=1 Tax=Actinoplanes auranticolor TaxID=47988 RepID=A0A919SIW4_9ACTN|nr:DUF4360 domain-containing protein [Actinoplanes auranticolor]GIM72439.1 hypothetical protein Aau02nite_50990 [Actinoplanes auranticolor]
MLRTFTAGAAMLAALAIPAPALAAPLAPPPGAMTVKVVGANGSGCPPGSIAILPSEDNTAFTVIYSEYTAQVGPDIKAAERRKNCQIALDIRVPGGFTYTIAQVDYRGYAQLAPGSSGVQTAGYYFAGNSQTARSQHNLKGPKDGYWQKSDELGITSLNYKPCGVEVNLNINTELRVNGGWSDVKKTTSMLTMDSTDWSTKTIFHLSWKKC